LLLAQPSIFIDRYLCGDEKTLGVSLRYVRQINQTASFHIGGTFSDGSKLHGTHIQLMPLKLVQKSERKRKNCRLGYYTNSKFSGPLFEIGNVIKH
jgi:hypothetical protein